MHPTTDFRPEDVIRLLGRHEVRYVLIGGLAAITHGSSLVTVDVDICHATDRPNLERLVTALREIHAYLRAVEPGLPFRLDAKTLERGDSFTLTTDLGALDLLGTPAGTGGFDDLARTADRLELFEHDVLVASVDDLIRMKRAAGRPKDLRAVEELAALRDEIDASDG